MGFSVNSLLREYIIVRQMCQETTYTGCVFLSVSPTNCAWSPTKQYMYIIACQITDFCISAADNRLWSSSKNLLCTSPTVFYKVYWVFQSLLL